MPQENGNYVHKYRFSATVQPDYVSWKLSLQLDTGEHVEVPIRAGEEIPLLLELCRRDRSLFWNAQTRTLTTGWNDPGDIH